MPVHIAIGLKAPSIESISEALRLATGHAPEPHESLYLGVYDLFRLPEKVQVKYNFVAAEVSGIAPPTRNTAYSSSPVRRSARNMCVRWRPGSDTRVACWRNPRGDRQLTTACTRPPTRRFSCSAKGAGRRVMPGVRRMTRGLLILLLFVSQLAANEPAPGDVPYTKVFDPWRACMAAQPLARRGAPDALRTLFLSAYVRVSQPFLGGEDLESMILIFRDVLPAIGDTKFSDALSLQRPEVRGAVRWFLDAPPKKFPRTARLLREAPEIDWPVNKAYRNDR